ncbi:MAG: YkgJ family cysteine cluster protein [Kiritimatiellia bacterium]|nr:YkgJ family cysteine cluster protein [Kiritimatiellia bacterium]
MKSPEFVCRQCGECCRWPGHVWLTEADIRGLSDFLGIPEQELIERYAEITRNRGGLSLIEKADGSCVFLKENRCRVYEARPGQCRDFPRSWNVEGCPAQG